MTAYFLVYGWICTASLLLYIKKIEYKKARNWFCILSFLAVFLLLACRHPTVGYDLRYGNPEGYLGRFQRISGFTWQQALTVPVGMYERGFIIFCKLLSVFSNNSQFFIAGCAAASLIPIWYLVYKQSKHPELSVYIFMGLPCFELLFSSLRQTVAVGLCALALLWIIRKKPVSFLLTVALAVTLHKSTAVFFVAYPVYHLKLNKPLRWCSCAVPILVYIFRQPLFALAGKFYPYYAVPDYNGSYRLFLVFYLVYLFCCIFSDEQEELCGLKNLFLGACCVQALAGMHSIVMRLGYCFTVPLILLLPLVVDTMPNKKLAGCCKAAISVCFVAAGMYFLRTATWSCIYPYSAFWAR